MNVKQILAVLSMIATVAVLAGYGSSVLLPVAILLLAVAVLV